MIDRKTVNYKILYAILAVIGIVIIIASAMNPDEDDVRLIEDGAQNYNVRWEYENNYMGVYEPCTLPLSLDKEEYRDLTIRKRLGAEARDGAYIMYRSHHAENKVYVDDRVVYTYATKRSELFQLPGSAWIIIPLKDSYKGKYLTIHLHRTLTKYGGTMEGVLIGDRADMLERLLVDNLFGIVTCIIILFASVLLFAMWVVERRTSRGNRLFYLALFTMTIFLWSINETHCTQLFVGNMQMVSILTYEILAFLPMPIVLFYCDSKYRIVRDITHRIGIVPIVDFCLINILHFLKMVDMSNMLPLTHISIFAVSGTICYAHIKAGAFTRSRSETGVSDMGVIGFFILVISVLIDIFHYYTSNYIDGSRYCRIGLLIFVLFLAFDTMNMTITDQIDMKKAEVYKTLAFTDSLTGLGNRQAYEQEIERINEREELLDHLVVGVLDLNNLKGTNDSLGHAEGDRYIISSSDIVQSYFGKIAKIFRIGGDEFAVLFTGHDSDIYFETEANMFDDIMNGVRQDVNFAYGSAVYNHITDRNAEDTIRRADEKMYSSKRKYKHRAGEQ